MRGAVMVDLTPLTDKPMAMTTSTSGDTYITGPGGAPTNIHGDARFIVKVQPAEALAAGIALVYDETRSFQQSIIGSKTPHYQDMVDLIVSKGIRGRGQTYKAYMWAMRKDKFLYILLDGLAPPQSW